MTTFGWRMRKRLVLVSWVLLLIGCGEAREEPTPPAEPSASSAPSAAPPCAADEHLAAWCGYKNAEDLAVTPDRRFLLATGFGTLPDSYLNEMMLFELAPRRRVNVNITLADNTWGDPGCSRVNTDLSPHGLDLVQRADGRHQVAITNHLPRETIEFFELAPDGEGWQLIWRGCVNAPADESFGAMFNDVALTIDGGFYATQMFDAQMPFEDLITAGENQEITGAVWRWDRDGGFSKLPGTEGSFPNGIALSPAENVLFVNHWFTGRTIRFNLETGQIEAEHLGGMADNLTLVGDDLWAAKHDMTLDDFFSACPADKVDCFLPFTIYRLSAADLTVLDEWSFDSTAFGFATVAIPADGRVWLGTAHGERIASFAPDA